MIEPLALTDFLAEPLRMAQVAAVSPRQVPLLGSLFFLFDEGRFWFSSHPTSAIAAAATRGTQVAVIVDDFTPPDSIRQIRGRGPGRVDVHDPQRVRRIYDRYLGHDFAAWPSFFQTRMEDPSWVLWSVSPDSGVVSVFSGFRAEEIRWTHRRDSPLPGLDDNDS